MITSFLKKRISNPSILDLLQNSFIYLIGYGMIAALSFFGASILTRFIPPEDYAIVSLLESYKSIFICLVTFNTYTALGRYLYEDKEDKKIFFGTLIIFSVTLILIFQSFIIGMNDFFSSLLGIPKESTLLIAPMLLIFFFSSVYEQYFIPLRKSKRIIIRKVLVSYFSFGLSIFLVYKFASDKYLGYLYGSIIIGSIFSLIYIKELSDFVTYRFNVNHLKYMLLYAIPLLPYTLSGVILAQFDKIMINDLTGKSDTGLYSFAGNIGMIIPLINSSFALAWMPSYYKFMEEKAYDSLKWEFSIIIRIIFFSSTALLFFGGEVVALLSPEKYHKAADILPTIIFGLFIYIIFTYYSWTFSFLKKNSYLSFIVLTGGLINILLNAYFIPKYGYIAAAYTTMVSYSLMLISSYLITRYYLNAFIFPLFNCIIYLIIFLILRILLQFLTCLPTDQIYNLMVLKGLFFSLFLYLFYLENKYSVIKNLQEKKLIEF
jgi:O-antigen/teichoic acid export membrane protein